jgi:transcriptional regulator with XRE-family HTH domain
MLHNIFLHLFAQINQVCQIITAAYLLLRELIRQLREEKLKMTQKEFAEVMDVTTRTVQRWENGTHRPRPASMLKMQELDRAWRKAQKLDDDSKDWWWEGDNLIK